MCYPKPGPRCSQHALLQYAKAHRTVLDLYDKEGFTEEVQAGIKARKKAEDEFYLTPAGIQELQNELDRCPDSLRERKLERLEKAKTERARLLSLVEDRKEVKHRKKRTEAIFHTNFAENEAELDAISQGDPRIHVAIEESAEWSGKLTDAELAAFRWYTQDGYSAINTYATTGGMVRHEKNLSEETLLGLMSLLDSAMAKKTDREPRLVYRRHLMYEMDEKYGNLIVDDCSQVFRTQHKVGDVFEPGFYMSSSLDPNNGPSNDRGPVFFEILTRKAVSLNAVSAQGSRETEYLMPRDAKYRIVSMDKKVTLNPSADSGSDCEKARTVSLIQLEEL